MFPSPLNNRIEEIEKLEIPSERLYGLVELRKKGWDVKVCDSRFEGLSGWLLRLIRPYGLNLIDFSTMVAFWGCDIVIMKDNFSLMATLTAKIMGRKIVYFDSMFQLPRKSWKRTLTKINLTLSDAIIAYSESQIKLWSKEFSISDSHFKKVIYTIDLDFYKPVEVMEVHRPFILSVGRDVGRDFDVLSEALDGSGFDLKLVTLPYLVSKISDKYDWIEVYENLSYGDLFNLYTNAFAVVVPLKENLSYPSGIRGVLESMALGNATVCTKTLVMEELFEDGKELIFVDAGNAAQIRSAIQLLKENEAKRLSLRECAMSVVQKKFGMPSFVDELEQLLMTL